MVARVSYRVKLIGHRIRDWPDRSNRWDELRVAGLGLLARAIGVICH